MKDKIQTVAPSWFKWVIGLLVVALIVVIVLLQLERRKAIHADIKVKSAEKAKIEKEDDSIKNVFVGVAHKGIEEANESDHRATTIKNTVKHEKVIIPSADYGAKCSYITNYRRP